jgi:hypothetical protein
VEQSFITQVHNWVLNLDSRSEQPDAFSIGLSIDSIVKAKAPPVEKSSKEHPKGYIVDWETIDSERGLAKQLHMIFLAKYTLMKALNIHAIQSVNLRDKPKVRNLEMHSIELSKFTSTIRGNMKASLVPKYLL